MTAQDVLAQKMVFVGLGDGPFEPLHRQWIFSPHIDDALLGTCCIGTDEHSLDDHMRIALHLIAIHVGPGVAFISIADDKLAISLFLGHQLPLQAGGKTRPTAPPQMGVLDNRKHFLPAQSTKH
ncbi:hypothetical protein SDC9_169992 [bioreactor metagenome]|uniref:Uncharacterized protein n=1 Tax=bioreactor metagenome TaxID=1076179 RepID=A0A645G9X3_9ZZZZ